MNFKEEIIALENIDSNTSIIEQKGNIPVIITAPHTIRQIKNDGSIKLGEPFTKAITLYLSNKLNTYALVKVKDTGIDSNRDEDEEFKTKLIDIINKNNILLSIDIHGADKNRIFSIELGTINNLSADYSTINELKESFIEHGISKVQVNDPFKGGAITRTIYGQTNCEAIQIEINGEYRDITNPERIEQVCSSIEYFIKQYIDTINRAI